MNRNIKIARQLVRIARMLVALDAGDGYTVKGLRAKMSDRILGYVKENFPQTGMVSIRGTQKNFGFTFTVDESGDEPSISIKAKDLDPTAEPAVRNSDYADIKEQVVGMVYKCADEAVSSLVVDDEFTDYAQITVQEDPRCKCNDEDVLLDTVSQSAVKKLFGNDGIDVTLEK